ncbi:MAG: formate--tetrahydrofolate ligase [Nitrosomonas sp.]|nr:formate--tetrahydrofolate ligase [Nitrosomonas sp.]
MNEPVTAQSLQATGAMAALLQDAILVEPGNPPKAFPLLFMAGRLAISHMACNSVIATRAAATYADYAVTEAGPLVLIWVPKSFLI